MVILLPSIGSMSVGHPIVLHYCHVRWSSYCYPLVPCQMGIQVSSITVMSDGHLIAVHWCHVRWASNCSPLVSCQMAILLLSIGVMSEGYLIVLYIGIISVMSDSLHIFLYWFYIRWSSYFTPLVPCQKIILLSSIGAMSEDYPIVLHWCHVRWSFNCPLLVPYQKVIQLSSITVMSDGHFIGFLWYTIDGFSIAFHCYHLDCCSPFQEAQLVSADWYAITSSCSLWIIFVPAF